jgi:hypothetical protein
MCLHPSPWKPGNTFSAYRAGKGKYSLAGGLGGLRAIGGPLFLDAFPATCLLNPQLLPLTDQFCELIIKKCPVLSGVAVHACNHSYWGRQKNEDHGHHLYGQSTGFMYPSQMKFCAFCLTPPSLHSPFPLDLLRCWEK